MESTHFWNRRARLAAVLSLIAGLPAIAQNFNTIDNFDDNDDEGWTHLVAGDINPADGRWELPDDRYTLRSVAPVGPGQSAIVLSTLDNSDEAQFQTGIMRVKVRVNDPNAGAIFGMRVLTDSQGILSGYTIRLNPSTLDANAATLSRVEQGDFTILDTLLRTEFNVVANTDYFAEISVSGSDLEFRIWVDGDTRPESPQMTASDAAIEQGRFMVGSFVDNQIATTAPTATFDDIEFADLSPTPTAPVVGDVNADGFVDLFWFDRASRNVLAWHMDNSPGDGVFFIDSAVIDTVDANVTIVGRGDFNNDGYTDLVYRNQSSGTNAVVHNIGRSDQSVATFPSVNSRDWHIVAVGDFNNDAKSDLLWRNAKEGKTVLWTMDGTTVTRADTLPTVAARAWHPAGAGDLNGDGNADIVWRNQYTGQNVLWQMNGATVVAQSDLSASVRDQRWQIGDIADFTGDSKADLVWRNLITGENVLWQMDGATVTNAFAIPQVADLNWSLIGMSRAANTFKKDDFNNDGRADIVWRNVANGSNLLWLMSGADQVGGVVALPGVSGADWSVAAVGDLNFDHKPDLLWRNESTGDNVLWLMNGTTLGGTVTLPGASAEWRIIGIADANNDRVNDIYWFNSNSGDVSVWLLDGTPGDDATVVGSIILPGESDPAWTPKGVDDIDGNGSPDIVWRATNGANRIWFMSGTILFNTSQLPIVADQNWDIAKVSDMNDDQIPDLVWHNNSTGASTIWLLSPAANEYYAGALFLPTVSDTNWHIQEGPAPTP